MDKLHTTPRTEWFVIVGLFALVVAMAALPAVMSVTAHISGWIAIATAVGLAAVLSIAITETWKHLPD